MSGLPHAILSALCLAFLPACALIPDKGEIDYDGDGVTLSEGDCWDRIDGPDESGLDGKDIYKGATETYYDGFDQDCGGEDDYDADLDGYVPNPEHLGKFTLGVEGSGQHLGSGDCIDLPPSDTRYLQLANREDVDEDGSVFIDLSSYAINPAAEDTWYDGIDQDCGGNSDYDQDRDGYDALAHAQSDGTVGDDCVDGSARDVTNPVTVSPAEVNPGVPEIYYDGIDQDCDNNDCDQDSDGFEVDGLGLGYCQNTAQDCNDNDGGAFPDLSVDEIFYNGQDDNCALLNEAGEIDVDGDADRDGYWADDYLDRVIATPDSSVTLPADYLDCWDDETTPPADFNTAPAGSFAANSAVDVNPEALDQPYDAIDQDCAGVDVNTDGVEDDFDWDGDSFPTEYYVDGTGTFGSDCIDCPDDCATATGELKTICDSVCLLEDTNPAGLSAVGVNPEVSETPYNGTDENCDDLNDYDADVDLYLSNTHAAYLTGGYATDDCDDLDPKLNPGASDDFYTGVDENCDNLDDWDADQDGYVRTINLGETTDYGSDAGGVGGGSLPGDDCDDQVATMNPGRTDSFNDGIDSDCSGNDDYDDDADGYVADADNTLTTNYGADDGGVGGGSLPDNDCDETDAAVSPGDSETCTTAYDDDCDGDVNDATGGTSYYADGDGDGYGAGSATVFCTMPSGYSAVGADCLDAGTNAASIYPGAAELESTTSCREDVDGDGYGSTTPATGATAGTDCDDSRSAVNTAATETCSTTYDDNCDGDINDAGATGGVSYYADADADGYGAGSVTTFCTPPSGYSTVSTDCDDYSTAAAYTFPGAASIDSATACQKDLDGDNYGDDSPSATGVTAGTDCDDTLATVSPADTEICATSYDDDCDGDANDAGSSDGTNYYVDADGDLYGAGTATKYCSAPSSAWSTLSTDCLDSGTYATLVFPGSAEKESASSCRQDADADGYGDTAPASGVTAGTDCDDDKTSSAAYTFPGAASIDSASACEKDVDGDNYGDKTSSSIYTVGTDCDDTLATVSPADLEVCATTDDDDCDGDTNDAGISDGTSFYVDADGDTYGAGTATKYCTAPSSAWSTLSTDCLDSGTHAALTFPGAAELTSTSSCQQDADADGYGDTSPASGVTAGTDCDDDKSSSAAYTFPGAASIDSATACEKDLDGDNYGDKTPSASGVTAGTDCDDTLATVSPGDAEVCATSYDDDCDGDTNDAGVSDGTSFYADADSDGYGAGTAVKYCTLPTGFSVLSTDCLDSGTSAALIFPGAAELESSSSCRQDTDADGYGDTAPATGVTAGTDCDDDKTSSATYTFPGAASIDSASACEKDVDGDNYGDDSPSVSGVTAGNDCDDTLATVSPADTEVCATTYDDNCDGDTNDSGVSDGISYYTDADGDNYGKGTATKFCTEPSGYSPVSTDCVDTGTNAIYIFPGSAAFDSASACMQDVDGDNFGSTAPTSGATAGTDCDDALSTVSPIDSEICDTTGTDEDCDGLIDDADSSVSSVGKTTYYYDADGDTFIASAGASGTAYCDDPGVAWLTSAQKGSGTDCVDSGSYAAYIFPGVAPFDSSTACMQDVDNDNYGSISPTSGATAGTDCDDSSTSITAGSSYASDADLDDYYLSSSLTTACSSPGGSYALTSSYVAADCDDTNYSLRTGTAGGTDADNDGLDDDCNGYIDDDSVIVGSVVLNEVMMYPLGTGVQWFELANTEAFDIDLTGWKMSLTSNTGTSGDFTIPVDAYLVIGALDTVVLCEESDTWSDANCDYIYTTTSGYTDFNPGSGALSHYSSTWIMDTYFAVSMYNTLTFKLGSLAVDSAAISAAATVPWVVPPRGYSLEFGTASLATGSGSGNAVFLNNIYTYWCDAAATPTYTDVSTQRGTPGGTNSCTN